MSRYLTTGHGLPKRRMVVVAARAALGAGLAFGCGSEAPETELADPESLDVRVARALGAHGVEYTKFAVDPVAETVLVDDDIEMDLDRVLEWEEPLVGGSSRLEGYYANANTINNRNAQTFAPPRAASIRLSFSSSVSSAWQTAFTQAAAQWSAATCIEIGTGVTATETLSVTRSNLSDANVYARATFPFTTSDRLSTVIHPGTSIRINTSFGCASGTTCSAIEGLSAQLKKQVALHEIGHTLGFTHRGTQSHIQGTSSGTYSTVMVATFGEPGLGSLSSDDVSSRDIVFKPVQVCQDRIGCTTRCP